MINGDHAQPQCHCPVCHDRGWIDDRSSALRYLRRCSCGEDRRQPVGTATSTR